MSSKYQKIRKHFQRVDPVIHEVMVNLDFGNWLAPKKNLGGDDYFAALCREIIGQQLSGKAASAIHKRFIQLFSDGNIDARRLIKIREKTLNRSNPLKQHKRS